MPFARMLADRIGVPVTLENDDVALTDAERWFGVGRGIPGFAVVTIGAGVGLGLVVDGRTVRTPDAARGPSATFRSAPTDPRARRAIAGAPTPCCPRGR